MNNTSRISTQKIIFLVVFISSALITSLFIFHLRHASSQPLLSPNDGLIFSAPRDLHSFELITSNGGSFKQQDLLAHWTLVFFGFSHCSSICPSNLELLKRVYTELHPRYSNLQVLFISLDPQRDSKSKLAAYTHSFHPDFIGASGNSKVLHQLQSQLGIFSMMDPAAPQNNYQLQHTASILLINPQGKWVGIFYANKRPSQLSKAIEVGLHTHV
jgi:protein SCO1